MMNIVKLIPYAKSAIWGGTKLAESYGVDAGGLDNVAEAWTLSCYKGCESRISGGGLDGCTLLEAAEKHPGIFGAKAEKYTKFPLLIKFIDARDDLSVQVHPDDEYAAKYDGSFGKTEVWYIVECDEGARIIYGFKNKITTEEFARAIESNALDGVVNSVEVKKGDFFLIEAGTLHAIGKGILVAEVQQSSDLTFRAYDYGRLDKKTGKPRELHIRQTLDVTKCEPVVTSYPVCTGSRKQGATEITDLVKLPLFSVEKIDCAGEYHGSANGESFVFLSILEGEGTVRCADTLLQIKKGDGVFVPAGSGEFVLSGSLSALESRI